MGNLKTYSMTLFTLLDYKNGRKIYSNYKLNVPYTSFNDIQELVDLFNSDEENNTNYMQNASICIDEFAVLWDCYSTPKEKDGTQALKNFARQVRKRQIKMYFTAQDYFDIPKAMRKVVQYIYVCRKLHNNYAECQSDMCKSPHILELTPLFVNGSKIEFGTPVFYGVDINVFKYYDTDQIIVKKPKQVNKREFEKACSIKI